MFDADVGDYYGEHQNQLFVCSGIGDGATLRVLRNGIGTSIHAQSQPGFNEVKGGCMGG